jgi:hypothetical protein
MVANMFLSQYICFSTPSDREIFGSKTVGNKHKENIVDDQGLRGSFCVVTFLLFYYGCKKGHMWKYSLHLYIPTLLFEGE